MQLLAKKFQRALNSASKSYLQFLQEGLNPELVLRLAEAQKEAQFQ